MAQELSDDDLAKMARTFVGMPFLYRRVGYDERPMVFETGGVITVGSAQQERTWSLERMGGDLCLVIAGNERTCELKPGHAGSWHGRWLQFEKMAIELLPMGGAEALSIATQRGGERPRQSPSVACGRSAAIPGIRPNSRDLRLADLMFEPRVSLADDRPEVMRMDNVYGLVNMLKSLPRLETIVEVGSFLGISTEVFLQFAEEVVSVDPWHGCEEVYQRFLQRVSSYPHHRVLREPSVSAAARFPDASLDLVYVDALHDFVSVREDILAWRPKVKPGRWISGHDFSPLVDDGGVIEAVYDTLGPPNAVFEDTSWLVRLS